MQTKQGSIGSILRQAELAKLAAKAGIQHQIKNATTTSDEVVDGRFQISRHLSDLLLHTVDACELQDMTASIQLPPSMVFSVVLEGSLDFSIGGRPQLIGPAPDTVLGMDCFAMNLLRPMLLLRKVRKGAKLRKVNISLQHQWLEGHLDENLLNDRQIIRFMERHLEIPQWRASKRLLKLTAQILNPPSFDGILQTLYVESKALEIVAASLRAITALYRKNEHPVAKDRALKRSASVKAGRIRKHIESNLLRVDATQMPQSLEQIASDTGMSISNLQRLFKQAHGQTVFEYVRQRRLEMARDAIEKNHISIGEAAYIAGYKHPSNFAAAFKRSFGVPPGSL